MIYNSRNFLLMRMFIFFLVACFIPTTNSMAIGPDFGKIKEAIKDNRTENKKEIKGKIKSKIQEIVSGMPDETLALQSTEKVELVTIHEAVKIAQQTAKEHAEALIDQEFHKNGKLLQVPATFPTISQAINAAQSGDTILVAAGTYYEQLVMKDGVKLVSDSSDNGDELVSVKNALIQLPRRTLRTIIDGIKTTPSKHGMIDFNPGVTNKTIVDGFTVRNLPHQDHHTPGHAHGLNIRGASPIIMNCYIKDMGSTGIGSHVVFNDQESPIENRDFRYANIKSSASAIIYNNIITGSLGLGIGCNHFSSPTILGNDVFNNNDSELGAKPSPGMGNKHGSHATIIGNIVHDNPGGGILCQIGKNQGKHPIDRTAHPTIIKNVVYDNGPDRPGISSKGAGSVNRPVIIQGNYVYNAGATGIALSSGATGIIENNYVSKPKEPGIAINASIALKLNYNQVTKLDGNPGIIIIDGGVVHEMIGNRVDPDEDAPPYLIDGDSTIKKIN
ncbi:MAG: right-handed parallel beta-helix repeat-containing protein [Desulfobulbaceae bacterium]|nr:right-handed parallel beta-helix repeat-containing protein [Desulfobulbaceae bacterium]